MWRKIIPLTLFVLPLFTHVASAAPQLVVVKSNVDAIAPGKLINPGKPLSLAKGQTITVVTATGSVIRLSGPYSGKVAVPSKRRSSDKIVRTLSDLFKPGLDDHVNLAVTRNRFGAAKPADPWVVHLALPGPHCIPAKAPVTLWRSKAGKKILVTMRAKGRGPVAVVEWPDGARTLPWPRQIEIVSSRTYQANIDAWRRDKIFRVFVVPAKLSTDIQRVVWMAEHGCRRQARLLLERTAG